MDDSPRIPASLTAFIEFAPENARHAMKILGAPVMLTDDLAARLLDEFDIVGVKPDALIECLGMCDFVVEIDGEWCFEREARYYLLSELEKDPILTRKVHALLLKIARDPATRIHLPAYLTWKIGRAFHTAVFDAQKALDLYRSAYTPETTGKGRLLGILAEAQQESGWLPASAIEPAFFRGMSLFKEQRWKEAESYLTRVSRSNEIRREVGVALHALAVVAAMQERSEAKAEPRLNRALDIFEQLEDFPNRDQVRETMERLLPVRDQEEESPLLIPGECDDVWRALPPEAQKSIIEAAVSGDPGPQQWRSEITRIKNSLEAIHPNLSPDEKRPMTAVAWKKKQARERNYPRFFCEEPVLFSAYETENYQKATMYNIGEDGMYIETTAPLERGADVCIKLTDLSMCKMDSNDPNGYRGEVKWINTTEEDASPVYAAGIMFKVKGQFCDGGCIEKMGYPCEICRKNMADEMTSRESLEYERVCSSCYDKIVESRDEKIKKTIEKIIEGNVV